MRENRPGLAVDEESQRAEEAWQLADAAEERLRQQAQVGKDMTAADERKKQVQVHPCT